MFEVVKAIDLRVGDWVVPLEDFSDGVLEEIWSCVLIGDIVEAYVVRVENYGFVVEAFPSDDNGMASRVGTIRLYHKDIGIKRVPTEGPAVEYSMRELEFLCET